MKVNDLIILLYLIPLIGIIDWILFRKYLICELCHKRPCLKWYSFIIPTALEVFCVFVGYVIGKGY